MSQGQVRSLIALKNPTPLSAAYIPPPPPEPPLSGATLYVCVCSNGVEVFGRVAVTLRGSVSDLFLPGTPGPGTYTTRAYSAPTGGTLLYESDPFTVPAGVVAVPPGGTAPSSPGSGTLSGVPSSGTAGSTLAGTISYTTANVSTPCVALVTTAAVLGQTAAGKFVDSLMYLSGPSGTVPPFTLTQPGTVRLALLDGSDYTILALSGNITIAASPLVQSGSLSNVPSSGTAGAALANTATFTATNISTPYAALVTAAATVGQAVGSALISGSAVALSGTSGTVPARTPSSVGTVYLVLLNGPTGTVLARSGAITVAAAAPVVTVTGITLTPASSITANSPIETPIGTLSAQTTGGALVNSVWSLTITASGKFKSVGAQARFAAADVAQASYTIQARVTSDNAAAFEQDLTVTVAAAAAPPATQSDGGVTLNNVPASIVAGQLMSGVMFTLSGVNPAFVLFNVTSGVEEGTRQYQGVMPPGNLGYLIPQANAIYTVRAYDNTSGGNLLFESSQISVSAPLGPLPAQVTQTADTNRTQTSVTLNWTATGTSYRVLARASAGSVYGSSVDTTVSTNSYTFTEVTEGLRRAIVIPQNANGFGTPSSQLFANTAF